MAILGTAMPQSLTFESILLVHEPVLMISPGQGIALGRVRMNCGGPDEVNLLRVKHLLLHIHAEMPVRPVLIAANLVQLHNATCVDGVIKLISA